MKSIIKLINFKVSLNYFFISLAFFVLVMTITIFTGVTPEKFLESTSEFVPESITEATNMEKVYEFIKHNGFVVPLQMFAFSLIPIQHLFFLNVIFTFSLLGFGVGALINYDLTKGVMGLISSIPHTLFEVFALCVFSASLFILNRSVRTALKNLFRKNKQPSNFKISLNNTFFIYVSFVLPLIIIAAFFETFLADFIMSFLNKG